MDRLYVNPAVAFSGGASWVDIRAEKVRWVQRESPAATSCCHLLLLHFWSAAASTLLHLPSIRTSSMGSSGVLRGLLLVGLLSVLCHSQASQEVSAEDFGVEKPEPAADRDLVEALEALLAKMHNGVSSPEKRGSIPLCGIGDRCAMKFGPRIGKLCDCGRGANCNAYLLKCI